MNAPRRSSSPLPARALAALALLTALFLAVASAAQAATPSPWWHLTQRLIPSRVEPEGKATLVVQAINLGDANSSKSYEISDALPSGFELLKTEFFAPSPFGGRPNLGPGGEFPEFRFCTQASNSVSCSSDAALELPEEVIPLPEFLEPLVPYDFLEMRLTLKAEAGVEPAAAGLNRLSASGGGAPAAAIERAIPIGTDPVDFGLEHFALHPEAHGGQVATHAASHPYQLTADTTFNRANAETLNPPALPRNLRFKLPAGQLGNATVAPQCSDTDFAHSAPGGQVNLCPADTAIGATVITASSAPGQEETFTVPVFNLTPALGEPARFGFEVLRSPVILDTSVRSGPGEDYGVTVSVNNTTQLVNLISASTVFWGAPADPSHNPSRGWGCILGGKFSAESGQPCEPSNDLKPPAFLTLPGDCAAPFAPVFEGTSWPTADAPAGLSAPRLEDPLADEAGNPLGLSACNQVPFDPQIEAEPTSDAATSPTGLNFGINFEDEGLLSADGVAQSQIKRAVVTLPPGFTTNPSVAAGLHACSQAAYESETVDSAPGTGCPEDSKIGSVEIESPLVSQKVEGSLFVAKQGENPNQNNLLTIYLVAKNPEIGILIKQALRVTPDPVTGQLTTEVDNVPELPFSHFHLSFRQGQRAPLVTPPACGTYTVAAELYPWSNPGAPVHRESSFQITQGPEGLPCPSGGVPPFHPNLLAGSENPTAGAYSPFYTDITRRDSEQEITHFSIKLPPGIAGILAGIPYCSDAAIVQAKSREVEGGGSVEEANPSCPGASQVGHSLVGSGVGNVLAYAPGKIYLAGPYHGSNLSLVSITAAKVGPFDLGTVVVRFALRVDPETAEVFVDSTGSDPIPHIVDGIPVHLRDIRAYVDRPNFIFNPTSCAKTSTASTVLGSGLDFVSAADDNPVTVSSPFQAADCASLAFKPKLALSLKGSTKRGGSPALKAVVTYPYPGANIREAQVTLPNSEFLDNAHIGTVCTRVQFKEGTVPGEKCPAGSVYGFAKAVTPVFSEPLEGPVYLRSTGTGAGAHVLPDLVAALHNKQVDIALAGHTEGTKNGGIRNTFEAVPDAPVSSFTLQLKGGAKSLLENHVNLCAKKHYANSLFTGQNGKIFESKPLVKVSCKKGKGKKKH